MNTAVRALANRRLFMPAAPLVITREYVFIFILAMLVLLSAFGLIYLKDFNRQLTSQYGDLQAQSVALHNQWTQLLLQKSQLVNQAHVAQLARDDYNMAVPTPGSVVLLDEN